MAGMGIGSIGKTFSIECVMLFHAVAASKGKPLGFWALLSFCHEEIEMDRIRTIEVRRRTVIELKLYDKGYLGSYGPCIKCDSHPVHDSYRINGPGNLDRVLALLPKIGNNAYVCQE